MLKQCIECGIAFAPIMARQKFCSPQCHARFYARKRRIKRKEQGLCPQCGGPMDWPIRIGSGRFTRGPKISYCSKCREMFKNRYKDNAQLTDD